MTVRVLFSCSEGQELTERYKKSFHYSALKEWSNTPKDIRELPTINSFKRQLKLYMKSKT